MNYATRWYSFNIVTAFMVVSFNLPMLYAAVEHEGKLTNLNDENIQAYEYSTEGRQDPFRPFISPKAATPTGMDPNEIIDETGELSGMQLFEPGQLSLAGILSDSKEQIALVEDQTKKGYILKVGTLIGKRGMVSGIEKGQVVITETARTRAGKEITSTTVMRLNKEGEK